MPVFIDPTGQPTYGIGICARCSRKMPLGELSPDPNSPGLLVCAEDLDLLDPYRLPARVTEDITLPFVRPDVPLNEHAAPTLPVWGDPMDHLELWGTEDGSAILFQGDL